MSQSHEMELMLLTNQLQELSRVVNESKKESAEKLERLEASIQEITNAIMGDMETREIGLLASYANMSREMFDKQHGMKVRLMSVEETITKGKTWVAAILLMAAGVGGLASRLLDKFWVAVCIFFGTR